MATQKLASQQVAGQMSGRVVGVHDPGALRIFDYCQTRVAEPTQLAIVLPPP